MRCGQDYANRYNIKSRNLRSSVCRYVSQNAVRILSTITVSTYRPAVKNRVCQHNQDSFFMLSGIILLLTIRCAFYLRNMRKMWLLVWFCSPLDQRPGMHMGHPMNVFYAWLLITYFYGQLLPGAVSMAIRHSTLGALPAIMPD